MHIFAHVCTLVHIIRATNLRRSQTLMPMRTKFYLDLRKSELGTLKIALCHKCQTRHITLDVQLMRNQWDGEKIVNHKNKAFLNTYIVRRKLDVDTAILQLRQSVDFDSISINDIKALVVKAVSPTADGVPANNFVARFRHFAETHQGRTRGIYLHTLKRMTDFCTEIDALNFEDITKDWIVAFDAFLARTMKSKNARNVHLRNIRAVFNDAIDNNITTAYPFRKISIKPAPTAKRSLSVEQLRTLFNIEVEPYAKIYQDLFKLAFMMDGINLIDLFNLKRDNIIDGRLEYVRAKTGREYSIKIEPEMAEIIERYKGKEYLLSIADNRSQHVSFMKQMNKALKRIGKVEIGKQGKKTITPLFPKLSYYWCRHSWATVAAGLDITKEVISHALGHGNNTVTDIYINFDYKKVDAANRKVIDYVLYDKK